MEEKTYLDSEETFYKLFVKQFSVPQQAEASWKSIGKPIEYPCVVVRACAKYIYVYHNDIHPFNRLTY